MDLIWQNIIIANKKPIIQMAHNCLDAKYELQFIVVATCPQTLMRVRASAEVKVFAGSCTFCGRLLLTWHQAALFASQDLENMTTCPNWAGTYFACSWERVEVHCAALRAGKPNTESGTGNNEVMERGGERLKQGGKVKERYDEMRRKRRGERRNEGPGFFQAAWYLRVT